MSSLNGVAATRGLDIVAIGETMLRLEVPEGRALEAVTRFDVEVAGAESNVAAILARLGYRSAWLSALPADDLGRKVENTIRIHGVDTSRVIWRAAPSRIGIYYWEPGAWPRPGRIIYDRAGSAFSSIQPSEIEWDFVSRARYLLVSGISAAVSSSSLATVSEAIQRAVHHGQHVAFDVNYRASLWSPEAARAAISPLLNGIGTLFCPSRDARTVFGLTGEPMDQARALAAEFEARTVVITCGKDGAVAWDGGEYRALGREAQEVDTIGRGDAFVAGFLHGLEREGSTGRAIEYGVALAALKQTYRGDIAWVTPGVVDDLVSGTTSGRDRQIAR